MKCRVRIFDTSWFKKVPSIYTELFYRSSINQRQNVCIYFVTEENCLTLVLEGWFIRKDLHLQRLVHETDLFFHFISWTSATPAHTPLPLSHASLRHARSHSTSAQPRSLTLHFRSATPRCATLGHTQLPLSHARSHSTSISGGKEAGKSCGELTNHAGALHWHRGHKYSAVPRDDSGVDL